MDKVSAYTFIAKNANTETISAEQTNELLKKAQNGDTNAIDKLVCANLKLVAKIASEFNTNTRIDHKDLTQEGVKGLMQAIQRCNPEKGKFSVYIGMWVRKYIRMALNKSHIVSVPKWETLDESEKASCSGVSIHAKANADSDTEIGDTLHDDNLNPSEEVERDDEFDALHKAIAKLPEKVQYIVNAHNGIGMEKRTLEEIASELGVTKQRVSQLELEAFQSIRAELA